MPEISKAKVLILATNGFEQDELLVPQRKLKEAGAQVDVVSPEKGKIRGWKLKDWARVSRSTSRSTTPGPTTTTPSSYRVVRSIPTCCASISKRCN